MSIFDGQRKFMRACGQTTEIRNRQQTSLYLGLLIDEVGELLTAANPKNEAHIDMAVQYLKTLAQVDPDHNRVGVFDGVLDVITCAAGVGLSDDLPLDEGWAVVMAANVAKVHPTIRRRADGKILKPEGWVGPEERLEALLVP